MRCFIGINLIFFAFTSLAIEGERLRSDCTRLDRDDRICNPNSKWNSPDKYSCDDILQDGGCDVIPSQLPAYKKCCSANSNDLSECHFNHNHTKIICPSADYIIDKSKLDSQLRRIEINLNGGNFKKPKISPLPSSKAK